MASCSYSSILKEKSSPCGSNWKNPENFSCVTLRDCNLDVASHLKSCKVADNRIENEVQLLLARAGTVLPFIIVFSDFSIDLWTLAVPCLPCCFILFTLCRCIYYWRVPHIVDSVSATSGKIWGWLRAGKVRCSIPSEIAGHKSPSAKGDRGISSKESAFVLIARETFLPIGTRETIIIIILKKYLLTSLLFALRTPEFSQLQQQQFI